LKHRADHPNNRQAVFERLLHRNSIRASLDLRALDVPRLYWRTVDPDRHRHNVTPAMAKIEGVTILVKDKKPTQVDLEPTEAERRQIKDRVMNKNAERKAAGLPERDVSVMAELGYARHRARAYEALLGPYLDFALAEIEPAKLGRAAGPTDYRNATIKAHAQLRDATGISQPDTQHVPVLDAIAQHRLHNRPQWRELD